MNGNEARLSPKKVILAVVITGFIIIASVGSAFQVASSTGLITAQVSVTGYVTGSDAESISLVVDSVVVETKSLSSYYYDYYQSSYSFYNVDVKANADHTYQVITSDGEESAITTEHAVFGDNQYIYLNIAAETTRVIIQGNAHLNTTYSTNVQLYIDGVTDDSTYVYGNNAFYSFTADVTENDDHTFMVYTSGSYSTNSYSNHTTEYIGSETVTITMDLP